MFRRIAVGDIMTQRFAGIRPSANLQDCAKELVKQRVNSLLVTEGKKLLGILTARDILWTITKKPKLDLKDLRAIDMATRKVAVIKPSADIDQALHKMRGLGFRRLPVLSKGEVVGMLTLKDILKVDPSAYREINELRDIRENAKKLQRLSSPEEWDTEGLCDECSSFAPLLKVTNRLLCPDCRDELY